MSDANRPTLRETLRADWAAHTDIAPSWRNVFVRLLTHVGFPAVVLFRISTGLHRRRRRFLARLVWKWNVTLHGCDLSVSADVGPGLVLPHPVGVVVGNGVIAGSGVTLYQGVTLGGRSDEQHGLQFPRLDDGVTAYPYAQILGPLTMGRNSIALAHAVVTRDVSEGSTVAGIPAVEVRS